MLLLLPHTRGLTPLGPAAPPVGAALVADLGLGIAALGEGIAALRRAPWCPLVLRMKDGTVPSRALLPFEMVPGTFALLHPADDAFGEIHARLAAAVRRRPVPAPQTIALWIERRLGRPGLASTLAACFGAPDEVAPPRTLTRRVGGLGPLEVRDWRGVARLAQLLALRGHHGPAPLETTALDAGVDPRTLRRWLRLVTPLPWAEVLTRLGWEWVVESALREGGIVARTEGGALGVARGA